MEVIIRNEDRKFLTMAEGDLLPKMKRAVDEEFIRDYCEMALVLIGMPRTSRIFDANAYMVRNANVNDRYFEGSGKLDVWIEFYALEECEQFVHVGAYLSDMYELSVNNKGEIRSRVVVDTYAKEA